MSVVAWVIGLHWGAVLFYVGATVLVAAGAFFDKERMGRIGHALVWPGLALHTAGMALWWRVQGHGPYVDRFEVLSADAWVLVLAFALFARIYPRIQVAAILVFPAAFSMVALGLLASPGIKQLPPTFRGIWLVLHIGFYKIALSAIVIATGLSALYVARARGRLTRIRSLSDLTTLDLYAYRFAGFGFVFWAIGMLAGSIWAYQSWNIFWNWDPVQTWSLVAWVLFGIYLHLRRFYGWKGERAAWLLIACFAVVVVAVFLTPLIDLSIHAGYFK